MIKLANVAVILFGVVGCGSNQPSDLATTLVDAGVCTWPSAFTRTGVEQAGSPIATGCWASVASGTAEGGTFSCSSTEYSLKCEVEMPSMPSTGAVIMLPPTPVPNSSLG